MGDRKNTSLDKDSPEVNRDSAFAHVDKWGMSFVQIWASFAHVGKWKKLSNIKGLKVHLSTFVSLTSVVKWYDAAGNGLWRGRGSFL